MSIKFGVLICALFVEFFILGETRKASITEYSYHVSVEKFGSHACSGALIYESWILTTASCVFNSKAADISIRVRTSSLTTGGDNLDVSHIVVHDEFDKYMYFNDIALIKLRIPAMFGEKLQPIALPEHGDVTIKDGKTSYVTGWYQNVGTVFPFKCLSHEYPTGFFITDFRFQKTSVESELSVISIKTVNQKTCSTVMPSYKPVSEKMLCAGNMTQGEETCQGDPGAPLMLDQMLIGILSYGLGCETMLHPGVYTRISSYLEWIALSSGIH